MAIKPRAAKAAVPTAAAAPAAAMPTKPRPSQAKTAPPTAKKAVGQVVEAVVPVAVAAASPAVVAAAKPMVTTTGSDTRIDYYPTHEQAGIKFRRGHVLPFGATAVTGGVNFSIYSAAATDCALVLF